MAWQGKTWELGHLNKLSSLWVATLNAKVRAWHGVGDAKHGGVRQGKTWVIDITLKGLFEAGERCTQS